MRPGLGTEAERAGQGDGEAARSPRAAPVTGEVARAADGEPRHRWQGPLLPAVAMVAVGLFVGFPLGPLVGWHGWIVPGDVWLSFEGGRYFVWGDFAGGLHYVSAPGTAVLFAPPAWAATRAGLVAAFPFPLRHPSAWLAIDPYVLVASATVVPAVDHLAGRLALRGRRRVALLWLTALFALPVACLWGHPEDVVAMALVMVGTASAVDGRWSRVGWIFGIALVMQPLSLLFLPAVLALSGPRTWIRVLWRVPVLTALVMAVPLLATGGDARRFVGEPDAVHLNFPTPVLWISPASGHGLVSALPARAVVPAAAVAIGLWAWRRKATPLQVVWCGAAAGAFRFLVEPATSPYYLWPAVALLLVVMTARATWWALLPAAGASVYSYFHREPWLYWLPLVLLMAGALAVTYRAAFRAALQPAPAAGGEAVPAFAGNGTCSSLPVWRAPST